MTADWSDWRNVLPTHYRDLIDAPIDPWTGLSEPQVTAELGRPAANRMISPSFSTPPTMDLNPYELALLIEDAATTLKLSSDPTSRSTTGYLKRLKELVALYEARIQPPKTEASF